MAGTVAANSNLLNLVDCDIAGPGFKGKHLCKRDKGEVTKWDTTSLNQYGGQKGSRIL